MQHDGSANFEETWRSLGSPISEAFAGLRVDQYLSRQFPFRSRNAWQKCMDLGEVLINRNKIKSSYTLKEQDQVHFYHPEAVEPDVDRNIRVLWREGNIMAVYKPGNLPMHESGAYRKNTFAHLLTELEGSDWSAVHRLDRETSGIVLCGATSDVRQKLASDFESKKIGKEYLALVNGIGETNSWHVDGAIGDLVGSKVRIKKWVVEGGQSAQTDFIVEAVKTSSLGSFSRLRAFPKTGRTNQIRIHAAHSGHWILGDKLYHPNEDVFLDYWDTHETTEFCVEQTLFHRCCLHAAALTFMHPETNQRVRIECEIPEDMAGLWDRL